MRFGSVCSGIEAASVAWNPLGWKAQWLAEIEPFPCSLLAHHYPDTPNLGDMTKFNEWPLDDKHAIDLLCGGTPCQSFSVAGLRKGLDDPRGNLMLTFGAIAAKYRPQWLVWENVPGVLSSNGGRDFGSFLGMLGQLGYGFAYRVLDAQYFGVAQRRRRVFVVGCLGDWRSAAAVLFERHSLQGHPAPSRQAREVSTAAVVGSTDSGGEAVDCFNGVMSGDTACTLTAGGVTKMYSPSVMIPAQDPAYPLASCPGAYASYGDSQFNYAVSVPAVAYGWSEELNVLKDLQPTIQRGGEGGRHEGVAVAFHVDAQPDQMNFSEHTTATLTKSQHAGVAQHMQVRRLTPTECERLQGFPDDYTLVPNRGKPAADGPRYKALGNSWAVPNVRWIGRRIDEVAAIKNQQMEIAA